MPVLKDFRVTRTITLPSIPDSKVEIVDSLLVGELASLDTNDKNPIHLAMTMLPKMIKAWNFTDESGKALDITAENLGFLKSEDVKFLIDQVTELSAESKKKESSSPA